MELWEDPEQIEQAIKTKLWEKYSEKQLVRSFWNYINFNHECFDQNFKKIMELLCPVWFKNSANINKEKLLQIAKNGGERPNQHKDVLGVRLCDYCNKNTKSYDIEFDKQIRKLRPDWFSYSIRDNQLQLLVLAKQNKPRPKQREGHLGVALCSYTQKTSKCYNKLFDEEIRKLRPDWFVTKEMLAEDKKKQLIIMAKTGCKRPSSDTTKIGSALLSYTRKTHGSYDEQFNKKIRKLRPDWFK